jgi:hypothetical protein
MAIIFSKSAQPVQLEKQIVKVGNQARLYVRVPMALRAAVDAYSDESGVPLTETVRRALVAYLALHKK